MAKVIINHTNIQQYRHLVPEITIAHYENYLNKKDLNVVLFCLDNSTMFIEKAEIRMFNGKWTTPEWQFYREF